MTIKFFESVSIFPYSWEQVSNAYWVRYPNPYSAHVLTEDTISRRVTPDGLLHSKRLMTKTNRMPKWGSAMVSVSTRTVPIVEESIVDPKTSTLTTYTRNIGLNSILSIVERVVYQPNAENGKLTAVERKACIQSSLHYGLSYPIAKFGLERYKKNINKTVHGYLSVLAGIYGEPVEEASHALKSVGSSAFRQLMETVAKAKEFAKKAKASPVFASDLLDHDDDEDAER